MSTNKLFQILKKHSGRNHHGRVTVRHQGGRQKRFYRTIDFKRAFRNGFGVVQGIEYDPNRNCNIAKIRYENDGTISFILAPVGLEKGGKVEAGDKVEITVGNATKIKNIPVGIEIHNVELNPGQGGTLVRSAGTFGTVIAHEGGHAQVKLSSGSIRRVHEDSYATIGRVGNIAAKDEIIGKAGRKRLMGIRPTVRGTAMNPRSHPHGGGEGRSGEGMIPKTPWGKKARGVRTRKPEKWTNMFIVSRRS